MFLIVKLILTVLINKTYGYIIQNREIILLPAWNPAGAEEVHFTVMYYLVFNTQSINQYLLGLFLIVTKFADVINF